MAARDRGLARSHVGRVRGRGLVPWVGWPVSRQLWGVQLQTGDASLDTESPQTLPCEAHSEECSQKWPGGAHGP